MTRYVAPGEESSFVIESENGDKPLSEVVVRKIDLETEPAEEE